eukprot:scaffold42_cov77-Skeletonema_marinoi.AAC.3
MQGNARARRTMAKRKSKKQVHSLARSQRATILTYERIHRGELGIVSMSSKDTKGLVPVPDGVKAKSSTFS